MDNTNNAIEDIDNIQEAYSVHCEMDDLTQYIPLKEKDLKIICQNIRSVYRNIDDLNLNLNVLQFMPDIIILSECRLNSAKPIPVLDNYATFNSTLHLNQNDGVVIYVKKDIAVTNIREIGLDHASCIQIDTYNTAILGIYRSPSNTNADQFITSLNTHLESIKTYKNIIITGDINIDLIPNDKEQNYEISNRQNYLNMLCMHGIVTGHTIPTRMESCLDHFMLKLDKPKMAAQIAVFNTTITDHSMTFLNLSDQNYIKGSTKVKTVTDFNNALLVLAEKNLTQLLLSDSPNYIVEMLVDTISETLRNNTKTVNIPKNKRTLKPWMTTGILKCIRHRNKLQNQCKLKPDNDVIKITYRRYRNFCNNLIKKVKRNYDRNKLAESTKNPKCLWDSIKSITYLKGNKTDNLKLLNIKSCNQESINYVNNYFSNIGKELAESIMGNQIQACNYKHNTQVNQPNSFVLLKTDEAEINAVLMGLKSDSAPGHDCLPSRFLKMAKCELIPIICHLTNLCFSQGIFPQILKKSVITPVHKSGEKDDVNNYRPISVLPSISKIIEKLINIRLINYLNRFNILSNAQYGFRNGRSTDDAVTALTTHITEQVESGKKCLAVFLDLKKAFDTVCIPILIQKLERIGIRDISLRLLKDYLSDRKQKVKVGQFMSDDVKISYGVPQGSVLGPTLFLVYINNLCNLNIGNTKIVSYADDTALVFSNVTWDLTRINAEAGLSTVARWLNSNLLTLNASKTNYICFAKYDRTQPPDDFDIKIHCCTNQQNCNCPSISKISKTKYLGVIIDQRLSWFPHIDMVSTRVRRLIWIFKSLRHITTPLLRNKIYVALAQSVISYCIPVWGGAAKTKFMELERAQRALIKVMYFKPFKFPTEEVYSLSKLLTVRKIYIINTVLKTHSTTTFDPNFANKRRKHVIINLPNYNSMFARRQFKYQSAHLYNQFNKSLDLYSKSKKECKKALTETIYSKSYEETENLIIKISR